MAVATRYSGDSVIPLSALPGRIRVEGAADEEAHFAHSPWGKSAGFTATEPVFGQRRDEVALNPGGFRQSGFPGLKQEARGSLSSPAPKRDDEDGVHVLALIPAVQRNDQNPMP